MKRSGLNTNENLLAGSSDLQRDESAAALGVDPELVSRSRGLSERVATYLQRVVGEKDALGEEVKSLKTAVDNAVARAEGNGDEAALEELKVARSIVNGHGPGGNLNKLIKRPNPSLLKLLLGPHVNVMTLERAEAIRLKEDYHAFRDRTAGTLFTLSGLLLCGLQLADRRMQANEPYSLTPMLMVGVQLLLCWLLYFYTAVALRENVLKVNGSNIRPWWIQHHYWSICTCLLLLTLPVDSPAVQFSVREFLWWTFWQSCVMILQNRYQRRRMYTRVALGKSSAMDVVSGESSGGDGQLRILYPMLFGLQLYQFFIGYAMIRSTWVAVLSPEGWLDQEQHESDLRGSRGVCLTGALMIFMATCNFRNTLATFIQKRAVRKKKRSNGEALSTKHE